MVAHRISLWILYLLTIALVAHLIYHGATYYQTPMDQRPYSALHEAYKPSGFIGHGVGIVGSALMLIMLLYSVRKRFKFMQKMGDIRYWLNYHIWMGLAGPALVLFHTTFKFGGIVAVSFWSMVGVAVSGIFGRYLYMQIPRSIGGQELSVRELEELNKFLQKELQEKYQVDEATLELIQEAAGEDHVSRRGGLVAMWKWMVEDVTLRFKLARIRNSLKEAGIHGAHLNEAMRLAKRKVKLRRRLAFLSTAESLLHHWHVIHRPFAVVMIIIMFVHIVVAVTFGYKWIFGTPNIASFLF
jgi:hypothetical protein